MAPALTEAGQSQNFKLPLPHSLPASPINVSPNGLNNLTVFQLLSGINGSCKSDLLSRFNESGKSPKSQTPSVAEITRKEEAILSCISLEASEPVSILKGSIIMNNCDPSMGDQNNMGLQKSNTTMPNIGTGSNFMREKVSNDMDQILHNLSSDISNSDLSQNVDELLQALNFKGMETGPSDVDVALPDSGPTVTSGSDNMFTMTSTDLTGGLPSFEGELFNDVDMMNMCDDVGLSDNVLGMENKEIVTETQIEEVRKKQFELERKCDFLIRRLRKLQARTIGKHASEEIVGLLEHAQTLSKLTQKETSDINVDSVSCETVTQGSENLKKVKGVTPTEMKEFVNRLDSLSQQQAALIARNHSSYKYFGSASDCGIHSAAFNGPRALPKFKETVKKEIDKVASQLRVQMQMVASAADSDLTASSSGGESCDEMQSFNNQHQMSLPITKRAAWTWARDRAGVACRWTWLQAQISDLEFKIRQQKEIKRQLQLAKTLPMFGSPSLAATVASVTTGTATTGTPTRNNHVVVNGFHGILSEALAGKLVAEEEASASSACSRTRPLIRSLFRKRRLLQMPGLHLTSKKAARPCTVVCGCRPCFSCAVCTGRLDSRSNRSFSPDHLSTVPERVALLDSTFHPVLSFSENVCESMHYDAIMKSAEWQQKTLRSSSLKSVKVPKTEKEVNIIHQEIKLNRKPGEKRKYTKRIKKPDVVDGIRPKLPRGRRPKYHVSEAVLVQRVGRRSSSYNIDGSSPIDGDYLEDRLQGNGSKCSSPVPSSGYFVSGMDSSRANTSTPVLPDAIHGVVPDSPDVSTSYTLDSSGISAHFSSAPGPSGLCYERLKENLRRKRENSYDIDNIVIPHSVAASTRLEMLRYKDIPTPGWRVHDIQPSIRKSRTKVECGNNGMVRRPSQEEEEDSDTEPMCDESCIARHDVCLMEERQRFLNVTHKLPSYMRVRTNRRADSRAESSGPNTPDPMSPSNTSDHQGDVSGTSPITSPPATPLSVTTDSEHPSAVGVRRRTVSQSRFLKDRGEGSRSNTPDTFEEVTPYELLEFPLSDELYQEMLRVMPPGHPLNPVEPMRTGASSLRMTKDSDYDDHKDSTDNSRPTTPSTDSTESAVGEDDPNDPEWTVEEARDIDRERRAHAKR